MNLIAAVSILLVTILTFQTTVINGAKSLTEHKQHSSSSKEHLAFESPSAAASDGDNLVRKGRGAKSSNQGTETGGSSGGGGGGVGKRGKNSKKLNKSTHLENSNAPATSAQSMSSDTISEERTKSPQHEQKSTLSSSSSSLSSGHQHNNKPKQRQMLKAQQHQTHVKRGGGNAKSVGEKKSEEQKQSQCRYVKSAWTECDIKTNSRSRTLTLKKGESSCQQSRTIQKKCKKACRYEKGAWTECTSGQMTRQDKLKTTSDAACEPVRAINKKCNPGGGGKPKDKGNKERKNKNKSSRKAAAA